MSVRTAAVYKIFVWTPEQKHTSRHTAQTDWVNNSSQTKNPDNLNYSFSDAKVLSKLASSYLAHSSIRHKAHHYPTSVTCCLLAHSDTAHTQYPHRVYTCGEHMWVSVCTVVW